jgi:hypothetical protein
VLSSLKLEIELVPGPLWGKSLAGTLPKDRWMALRSRMIQEKGERCEVCGQVGSVQLHEIWHYDDKRHIQRLAGFQILCLLCHQVKHMGRTSILAKEGKLDLKSVIDHFCKVNGCTPQDYKKHEKEVREKWKERSKYKWTQDLSLLERIK